MPDAFIHSCRDKPIIKRLYIVCVHVLHNIIAIFKRSESIWTRIRGYNINLIVDANKR